MRRLVVLALVAGAFASPASALGATRYAGPSSTVTAGPCTDRDAPCALEHAVENAATNDTVVLLGGTYDVMGGSVTVPRRMDIRGADGPRPVLSQDEAQGVTLNFAAASGGSTLRHVELRALAGGQPVSRALLASGQLYVRDVAIEARSVCAILDGPGTVVEDSSFVQDLDATSGGQCLHLPGGNSVVRRVTVAGGTPFPALWMDSPGGLVEDVTVTTTGTAGQAAQVSGSPGAPITVRRLRAMASHFGVIAWDALITDSLLHTTGDGQPAASIPFGSVRMHNVTAVAPVGPSHGIRMDGSFGGAALVARNTIARGNADDVFVPPGATATLSYSNFRSSGPTIIDGGANQSGDPLFFDPISDLRLRPESPAIDAGVDDPLNGPLDLAGNPRRLGSAPDIGAYETARVSVSPPLAPDQLAPVVTRVGVTNEVFVVSGAPTPVNLAGRRKAKKGTLFRFSTSEAGRATLRIQRRVLGRRVGNRCLKPTRRNGRRRRCTRYTSAGRALTRAAVTGANTVPFSGRIGRRKLAPGRYRVVVTVRDAAGNTSSPKTAAFRIVRR
jgi:hypothetical protein